MIILTHNPLKTQVLTQSTPTQMLMLHNHMEPRVTIEMKLRKVQQSKSGEEIFKGKGIGIQSGKELGLLRVIMMVLMQMITTLKLKCSRMVRAHNCYHQLKRILQV
jgi:hypothetical protein